MQTDYPTPIDRTQPSDVGGGSAVPVSVSHVAHVLRIYRAPILLTLGAVALAFLIVATAMYLMAPATRDTIQNFRLDFQGASENRYPNGMPFNPADIISGPILIRVYNENNLSDYLPFGIFSRSVFVLESNREYDRLVAEYQARLSDPKLSAVDRDRIEKEFDLKRQSISKNEYAIHFTQPLRTRAVPDTIARKVVLDVLNDWADFVVNQQHVTSYRVSVLSADILQPSDFEQQNPVAAIDALHSRANRVMTNIDAIKELPSANLVRTSGDHVSLDEIRLRVEEIVRFRLEPLISVVRTNGLADPGATMRFLESQLAYDQRQLEANQQRIDSARNAIAAYEQPAEAATASARTAAQAAKPAAGTEPVTPQLSDSFLDRLLEISGRATDLAYRQKLIDDYRNAMSEAAPAQQAVAYDTQVINDYKTAPAGGSRADASSVNAEIQASRSEMANLVRKVNELLQIINRNMTPSAQLFTITSPPTSVVLRSASPSRFALYGLFLLLVVLALSILAAVVYDGLREEDAVSAEPHIAAR